VLEEPSGKVGKVQKLSHPWVMQVKDILLRYFRDENEIFVGFFFHIAYELFSENLSLGACHYN